MDDVETQTESVESPGNGAVGPFDLDPQTLSTLSPEARVAVEPILKGWTEKASKTIEKEREEARALKERAEAFNALVNNKSFLNWYEQETKGPKVQAPTQEVKAPSLTAEELLEAQSDPAKFQEITRRQIREMAQAEYAPVLNETRKQTEALRLEMEIDQVARDNPDFWKLDEAGMLEPFLYYFRDVQGKSIGHAYAQAKKVWDLMGKESKKIAQGMVAGSKSASSEGPSTTRPTSEGVVWAKDADEARRLAIEAALENRKIEVRVKSRNRT